MPRPKIRALLIDLSGTLHIGSVATPSSVQALQRLRDAHIPFRLCSNTSKESTSDLVSRLEKMGFWIKRDEVWTSLGAVGDALKERGLKRPYCLLSKSAMQEFPNFEYIGNKQHESISHKDYDSVIIGLAPELLTYDRLTTAFRILTSPPSSFSNKTRTLLATHRSRYIRTPDGELSLGPGPFVAALENALGTDSGVHTEVLGKPSRPFFERVLESFRGEVELDPVSDSHEPKNEDKILRNRKKWHDVAIIGDDVTSDLGEGAIELGLWRVLVQTGKYREGDEKRYDSEAGKPPDEVQPSFAAFVDSLLDKS